MGHVKGVGGLFFRAKDPAKLLEWYDKNLGIGPSKESPWGEDDTAPLLEWRDKDNADRKCYTVFSIFPQSSDYMGKSPFMFNFRVDDLDAALRDLRAVGVSVVGEIQSFDYGRFAHITDPEGNPIELWEPAEGF
jgi:uncharacterized glyoxalase superfamily protein PhnB